MLTDPLTLAICLAGVFVISFAKGAFGGGLAVIGIPVLALALDPLTAGAVLAPLFLVMDAVALRYWSPSTWSRREALLLIPTLLAGIALGTLLIGWLDPGAVSLVIGCVTLLFAAQFFLSRGRAAPAPPSRLAGGLAGVASGVTTMIAHAGGPPIAMYMLRLGLPKSIYAGTTSLVFTIGNIVKIPPWLMLAPPGREAWLLAAAMLPAIPAGIWAGWRLHNAIDQRRLFALVYALLSLAALRLVWQGLV